MSLNTSSIVVFNALYTFKGQVRNLSNLKRNKKNFLSFFIHCFYFYSVDVAFVLNKTINIFSVI